MLYTDVPTFIFHSYRANHLGPAKCCWRVFLHSNNLSNIYSDWLGMHLYKKKKRKKKNSRGSVFLNFYSHSSSSKPVVKKPLSQAVRHSSSKQVKFKHQVSSELLILLKPCLQYGLWPWSWTGTGKSKACRANEISTVRGYHRERGQLQTFVGSHPPSLTDCSCILKWALNPSHPALLQFSLSRLLY